MSSEPTIPSANIIVVDDEPAARSALVELLRAEGFAVRSAADGFKALGQVDDWTPDLLVTDVKMPGMDGLALMAKLRERFDDLAVVVMTAHGTVEHAVAAMQEGADDYLTKPLHFPELLLVVRRVLSNHALRRENAQLRTALADEVIATGLEWAGRSKESRSLLTLVRQVAESDASALVIGEGGTGKSLVARALHEWSPRRTGPFVAVQCAQLDVDAQRTELFGSADGAVPGAFADASGGTLLLDDVGELPLPLQLELLRVLQERTVRVGEGAHRPVDVRVVATTRRDLHEGVNAGRFREDLFYRLDVITLRTPPLAQRREDIPALAKHFLEQHAVHSRKDIRGFTDRALRVLLGADWPGNVRQLESCIERAVVMCTGHEIEPRHLPRDIMAHERASDDVPPIPGSSMAELERYAILKTLEHVRGSTSKAAEMLGISPRKIQYRLAEYRGEPTGQPTDQPTGQPGERPRVGD